MLIKRQNQFEAPATTSSPRNWMTRIDVLRSLRLHKTLATVIFLFTLGAGLTFRVRHRPTYVATSVVYVSPNFPATLKASEEQDYPYDSYIEEQVHSVVGYNVLADALRRLQPGIWQFPHESIQSAVNRLQHLLTVKRDGLSYQVQISLQGRDPSYLADIVTAVTDSYLSDTQDEEFYGRDKRLAALREERAQVQKDLNDRLKEQTQISQSLGVAQISTEGPDLIDTQVAKLRTDLAVAREERIQAEAQLSALKSGDQGASNAALDAAADEIVANDQSLLALKSSLSQKRALLIDQLSSLTSSHPLRKSTEQQLSDIEGELQRMQAKLRNQAAINLEQKLHTNLLRASTVESKLLSELEANTKQATGAAPSFERSRMLKAEVSALQARYAALDERTKNLELESKSPGAVHLFSAALPPTGPLPSLSRFVLPLILPFSLLFATVCVVVFDFVDPRVYTGSDIEYVLGFAPIASLFVEQDVSIKVTEESILRLAGGIDHAVRAASVRVVVLTSVASGGGTTSIVQNVANALAKLGRKTLTIDSSGVTAPMGYIALNVEQPTHRSMGGTHGNALNVERSSNAVIPQSFSPKLPAFRNLMDENFKEHTLEYDIVLIDAAPILISAETEYLARFADMTILIAESGLVTKSQLTRASRLLERLQIAGVAVVVNKIAYRLANREAREDLKAFEARTDRGDINWPSSWAPEDGPSGYDNREPVSEQNSTYA
jgi:uncharacterized protein involved in exopolysaccharide biosynthesis